MPSGNSLYYACCTVTPWPTPSITRFVSSYLRNFPIDTLKIDRSFITDAHQNPDAAAITAAIVNLAHQLKLTTVAEGVETPEQLKLVRTLHCDTVQGYIFAPPLPPDEAIEFLHRPLQACSLQ